MTKYRIVKLQNGKYTFQTKGAWFTSWYTYWQENDTIAEVREDIERDKEMEWRAEQRRKRKVIEVIE